MTDSGNYAARATAIRETAKWIAAVFAGAGAILFSGLSFTNVSKAALTDDWLLPVVLAAVPVLAAGWAVREAAAVITSEPPNPGDLVGPDAKAQEREQLQALLPATIATYGRIEDFEQRLLTARDAVDRARRLLDAQPEDLGRKQELAETYKDLDALQEGVRDVVLCADYLRVRARYDAARPRLLAAAVLAVVAAAGSGVMAGEAERNKASPTPALTAPAEGQKVAPTPGGTPP